MKDFAARAMMKVIAAGSASQNIASIPLSEDNLQHVAQAHIPLENKRDVLASISDNYGLTVILQLGQGIHQVQDEPMKLVFLSANTPEDLFRRWERMQKFVHSRHRVHFQQISPQEFQLKHVSLADMPPQPQETCLVMSVLMALLSHNIGEGMELVSENEEVRFDGSQWFCQAAPKPETIWRLHCQPQPTDDSALVLPWKPEELVDKLRAMFRHDPCYKWTIKAAAKELCKSSRTLQRLLTAQLTSFTRLLVNERVLMASEQLVQSEASLTEIGFLTGFNSSSHFTTLFQRSTGMSPGQFRKISRNQTSD